MAYTVASNDRGEYIHVVHSGPANPAEILVARAEAVRELSAKRWCRFLVDLQGVAGKFAIMDHFNLVTSTAQDAGIGRARIALVINAAFVDDFRFAEVLAINRALDLRIFTDAGAAVAWLTEI